MTGVVRLAAEDEAEAITTLVNAAFQLESFFKVGQRTNIEEVRAQFRSGEFLVLDVDPLSPQVLAACVYLEYEGTRAYFGMLSIDPPRQGRGLGRLMLEGIEAHCRARGCTSIEIHVVNLREELPPFYRRFGFEETARQPYPDDGSSTRPCHFIVMTKAL